MSPQNGGHSEPEPDRICCRVQVVRLCNEASVLFVS